MRSRFDDYLGRIVFSIDDYLARGGNDALPVVVSPAIVVRTDDYYLILVIDQRVTALASVRRDADYLDIAAFVKVFGVPAQVLVVDRGDLRDLDPYDWRLSPRNVWRVERYCNDLDHTPFRGADRRYDSWHERYIAYRRRHPGRKPLYFANRATWAPGYPRGN